MEELFNKNLIKFDYGKISYLVDKDDFEFKNDNKIEVKLWVNYI